MRGERSTAYDGRDSADEGQRAEDAILDALKRATKPLRANAIAEFAGLKASTVRGTCKRLLERDHPAIGWTEAGYFLTTPGVSNAPTGS